MPTTASKPAKIVSHFDVDMKSVMNILGDMALYRYCPALEPLRAPTIELYSKIKEMDTNCRRCDQLKIISSYKDMLIKLFEIVEALKSRDAAQLDRFKDFMRERRGVDAARIVINGLVF